MTPRALRGRSSLRTRAEGDRGLFTGRAQRPRVDR